MAITVRASPSRLTWSMFRAVDSIPDGDDEEAQIAPIATGLNSIRPERTHDGNFRIPSLTITVGVDRSKTLILRSADKTPDLLKHEQGHFDLLYLVSLALARELESIEAISPSELGSQLQDVKDRHDANAQAIDKAYDDQTDHSRNRASQTRWDSAIAAALRTGTETQISSMPL